MLRRAGFLLICSSAALGTFACGAKKHPPRVDSTTRIHSQRPEDDSGACKIASEGCPCETPGDTLDCGEVKEYVGDFLWCSMGERTCVDGTWGACVGSRELSRQVSHTSLLLLGDSQRCAPANPCDPYCFAFEDDATELTVGPDSGLTTTPTSIVLEARPLGDEVCSSLALEPDAAGVTVTSIAPLAASDLNISVRALPDGCAPDGILPVWSTDDSSVARVLPNGDFTLLVPRAGRIRVTAFAGNLQGSVDIDVQVRVHDDSGAPPGTAGYFGGSPIGGVDPGQVLYPYANTVFPLGLPPPLLQWQGREGISASSGGGCSLLGDGAMACWGANLHGQEQNHTGPYERIAAYGDHTCALDAGGAATCWGRNNFGQASAPAGAFLAVAPGGNHTCGILATGYPQCWGDNSSGQATPPNATFSALSSGERHTCGIRAVGGDLVCWGDNQKGQAAGAVGPFRQVTAGASHTCALSRDGRVTCIGDNALQQLAAPTLGSYEQLAAGRNHTCALRSTGSVVCWGDDAQGQASPSAGPFVQLAAAGDHTCGLGRNGAVTCWGESFASANPMPGSGAVQVSLRYPATGTPKFEWSAIREERVPLPVQAYSGPTELLAAPRFLFPPEVWAAFEQSARGSEGAIVLQRHTGRRLFQEQLRRVHFANGQLKGHVVYQSYGTHLVQNTTGIYEGSTRRFGAATLAVDLGAASPRVVAGFNSPAGAVGLNHGCRSCHSVAATGDALIASYAGMKYGLFFTPADAPNQGAALPNGTSDEGVFLWSAIHPSGTFAFTHSGPTPCETRQNPWTGSCPTSGYTGTAAEVALNGRLIATFPGALAGSPWVDTNTDGLRDAAPSNQIFSLAAAAFGQLSAANGLPSGVRAAMPAFSPEGDRVVFNHYAGDLPLSDGSTATGDKRSLAMADFDAATQTFANFRRVSAPGSGRCSVFHPTNPCVDVWPSALPGGAGVVFEREVFSNSAIFGGVHADFGGTRSGCETPDAITCTDGSKGELWWAPLDASGVPGAATKLVAASGQVTPDHMIAGANGHVAGIEEELSYEPFVSPVDAGGYSWVVFTSRRRFGNVATGNPWASDPRTNPLDGKSSAKKLWVAAISQNLEGADVSVPAFYLPGQEYEASNGRPRWVQDACVPAASSPSAANECELDADCCGAPASARCEPDPNAAQGGRKYCWPAPDACLTEGSGVCRSDADCCDVASGAVCASGLCQRPPRLTVFVDGIYQRDFQADCPATTQPVWQVFEWKANVPDGTGIDFVASSVDDPLNFLGAPQVAIGSAQPGADGVWTHGGINLDAALRSVDSVSNRFLRVEMYLHSEGAATPSLTDWRVLYDCLPAE